MPEKQYRLPATVALFLGFAALYFILLLTAVHAVGTDDGLYHALQTQADILPASGISDEDLRMLDGELAKYLAGRPNELLLPMDSEPGAESVLALRVNGALQPAFNEREMAHLRDCLGLFTLLRKVRRRLIPWAILLIVSGAYILRDRRRVRGVAWLSPLAVLVPLAGFAAWAAADFNAAFNAFHRVLFTNDLWLLDPRTDLLIRICPASMFAAMGLRIAVITLASMIAVPALVALLTAVWPKGKEDNTWNNRDMRRASAPKRMNFGRGAKR